MNVKHLLFIACTGFLCCFFATASAELLINSGANSKEGKGGLVGANTFSGHGMKVEMSDPPGFEKNILLQTVRPARTFSDSGSNEGLDDSGFPGEWLVAEVSTTKRGLFGTPDSVVGHQEQTKEWQARTLRTMGITELSGGALMVLGGLALISDSGIAGVVMGGIGAFWAYIGYTDLMAAKRFFYPDPLLSKNRQDDEYDFGDLEKSDDIASLIHINKTF